jgi:hypothetical protein
MGDEALVERHDMFSEKYRSFKHLDFLGKALDNLCPIFELPEGRYALLTHRMTRFPIDILNSPVGHLNAFRDEIITAIDFVITGI